MIPLVEEDEYHYKEFKFYEHCYFKCGTRTKYWHWRTNQPVCTSCAKKRRVPEIENAHQLINRQQKRSILVVYNDLCKPTTHTVLGFGFTLYYIFVNY